MPACGCGADPLAGDEVGSLDIVGRGRNAPPPRTDESGSHAGVVAGDRGADSLGGPTEPGEADGREPRCDANAELEPVEGGEFGGAVMPLGANRDPPPGGTLSPCGGEERHQLGGNVTRRLGQPPPRWRSRRAHTAAHENPRRWGGTRVAAASSPSRCPAAANRSTAMPPQGDRRALRRGRVASHPASRGAVAAQRSVGFLDNSPMKGPPHFDIDFGKSIDALRWRLRAAAPSTSRRRASIVPASFLSPPTPSARCCPTRPASPRPSMQPRRPASRRASTAPALACGSGRGCRRCATRVCGRRSTCRP